MGLKMTLHAGIVVPNPLEEFFLQVHMNQDGLLSKEQHAQAQQTTGKPACVMDVLPAPHLPPDSKPWLRSNRGV